MNDIVASLPFLFAGLVGFLLIKDFNLLTKVSDWERLMYGYGLGLGLIALQLYLYSRLGIVWSIFTVIFPWCLYILFVFLKKDKLHFSFGLPQKLSFAEKLLIMMIVSLAFFVGFEALLRPLSAWDGWASWLLKAKIFYIDGKVNSGIFQYIQSEYPLLISLFGTFFYVFVGGINDRQVLLEFYFFYLVLGGVFFFGLKKYVGRKKALLFTFLLLSTQNLIRHGGRFEAGYADLPLGYYLFSSVMLCISYMKSKSLHTLILLQLFLVFATLTKNEGIPFALLVECFVVYSIWQSKRFSHFNTIGISAFVLLDWQIFKMIGHFPSAPPYLQFSHLYFDRVVTVCVELTREFFNFQNWNLVWIAFWLSVIFYIGHRKTKEMTLVVLLILGQIVVYFATFLITNTDPASHIRGIVDRLFLHVAPLAVFFTAMVVFKKESKV